MKMNPDVREITTYMVDVTHAYMEYGVACVNVARIPIVQLIKIMVVEVFLFAMNGVLLIHFVLGRCKTVTLKI